MHGIHYGNHLIYDTIIHYWRNEKEPPRLLTGQCNSFNAVEPTTPAGLIEGGVAVRAETKPTLRASLKKEEDESGNGEDEED